MIYFISSMLLTICFMFLKKDDNKQNLWRALAVTIMGYICYLCLIAGVMGIVHIPIDIYSVSLINVIATVCIGIKIIRNREVQKYYIDLGDTVFLLIYTAVIVTVFIQRFSINLNIIFGTSDPGVHLGNAVQFTQTKTVSFMYIGQLINGLFIEALSNYFTGVDVYKPFIIQIGFNLFLAGYVFWAAASLVEKNLFSRLLVYVVTFFYTLGYPYNDMLYGFVYLQMTITVIGFLMIIMSDFLSNEKSNIWLMGGLLSIGCLGVGIGYTLFAPPIFIAVLVCIIYKANKENWLFSKKKYLPSVRFLGTCMYVFLLPSFLTLWYQVFTMEVDGQAINYGTSLMMEGGIYRNLYSDFFLWILPALYGILLKIKEKRFDSLTFSFSVFVLYYLCLLYCMFSEKVSTYYFYKMNYLMWFFVLFAFIYGLLEICKKEYLIAGCITVSILFLSIVYFSDFENKTMEKNIYFMPYKSVNVFFQVYDFHYMLKANSLLKSSYFLETTEQALKLGGNEEVFFVGYWENLFWYEALTGWEFGNLYRLPYKEQMEEYINHERGHYAVIQKGLEELEDYTLFLEEYKQFIIKNSIYENEYAYIVEW